MAHTSDAYASWCSCERAWEIRREEKNRSIKVVIVVSFVHVKYFIKIQLKQCDQMYAGKSSNVSNFMWGSKKLQHFYYFERALMPVFVIIVMLSVYRAAFFQSFLKRVAFRPIFEVFSPPIYKYR